MKTLLLLVVLTLVACVAAERTRYDGYKVLEVKPKRQDHVKALQEMMHTIPWIDFWKEPTRSFQPTVFMVPPKRILQTHKMLRKIGILKWKTLDINVQEQIDRELLQLDSVAAKKAAMRTAGEPFFLDLDQFHPYDDVMAYIDYLPGECPAGLTCTVTSAGSSVEGRDIKVITFSTGAGNPAYIVDGVTHAREWITIATIMKMMDHMIYGYGSDADVTRLLDNFDFVFLPIENPDGYEFTWTDDRMWRKNRAINAGSTCIGVDANRNFDHHWGTDGVSHNPCMATYCGAAGNDQPESQAVDSMVADIVSRQYVPGYFTMHAYGNMWLHPWGYTSDGSNCELTPDHDDLYHVATVGADAVEAVHNTNWIRGNACLEIYPTSGTTDDYVKGIYDIKYPVCIEMRGNSFIIDPTQIQLSFEEVWAGVVAAIDEIAIMP